MATVLAVVFGLILGSFTSVVVRRLGVRGGPSERPGRAGIVSGRSECPECGHLLGWYDLIPLASFLLLRGRCRYCRTAISPRYPLMEAVMGGVLGGYVFVNGFSGALSFLEMGIVVVLVMLFFFDMFHHLLPDELVIPAAVLAVVRIGAFGVPSPVSAAIGALFLMVLFGALHFGSRGRWMGFGDVGLGAVLGLVLGWPASVFVLVFAVWIGALVGVVMMSAGRAHMKTALPFGSFLAAVAVGTLIRPDIFARLATLLIL